MKGAEEDPGPKAAGILARGAGFSHSRDANPAGSDCSASVWQAFPEGVPVKLKCGGRITEGVGGERHEHGP